MDNETLIIILFLVVNILTAICIALLDSRDYWRKKYFDDEEIIYRSDKNG